MELDVASSKTGANSFNDQYLLWEKCQYLEQRIED